MEQVNKLNRIFNNSFYDAIKKQQQIINSIKIPSAQLRIISQQQKEIRNLLNQRFDIINRISIPNYSHIIRGIDISAFQNIQKVYSKSLFKITDYTGNIQRLRKTIYNSIAPQFLEVQNRIKTINLSVVDWETLNRHLERDVLDDDSVQVTEQEIKEVTMEVLEESGILQSHDRFEEQLNTLIQKVDKVEQPWYKAVFLSIIATLIMMFLSPILEPLQKEYTEYVQQNGRMIMKEIKEKVHSEVGSSAFLSGYKIISTENMVVRITDKKNSNSVGKVYFGQLVRVIEKKRNWSLISYEDIDGNLIEGWVYTRYLSNITC